MMSISSQVRIRACGLLARPDRPDWLVIRDDRDHTWRLPGGDVTAAHETPADAVAATARGALGLTTDTPPRFSTHTWTQSPHDPPQLVYLFTLGTADPDLIRPQRRIEVNWVHRVMTPRLLPDDEVTAVLRHLGKPQHNGPTTPYLECLP